MLSVNFVSQLKDMAVHRSSAQVPQREISPLFIIRVAAVQFSAANDGMHSDSLLLAVNQALSQVRICRPLPPSLSFDPVFMDDGECAVAIV